MVSNNENKLVSCPTEVLFYIGLGLKSIKSTAPWYGYMVNVIGKHYQSTEAYRAAIVESFPELEEPMQDFSVQMKKMFDSSNFKVVWGALDDSLARLGRAYFTEHNIEYSEYVKSSSAFRSAMQNFVKMQTEGVERDVIAKYNLPNVFDVTKIRKPGPSLMRENRPILNEENPRATLVKSCRER